MAQQQEITVRRAKVSDASDIAVFVKRAWREQMELDESTVLDRFGNVGFLLAERDGDLVGILGWRAENLVVRLTDLLVGSISEHVAVSRALLSEMERTAAELQCEVALLFLPRPAPSVLVKFFEALGYELQVVVDLPAAWRDAAREGQLRDDETVLVKPLRVTRVIRPL